MLLFPYHTVKPATIPFRVTHLILAGTRSVVTANIGLGISASTPNTTRTPEERKVMARKIVGSLVDPVWIEANSERFEAILKRSTNPNTLACLLSSLRSHVDCHFSYRPREVMGSIITILFKWQLK
jgi:hypothetical protein